MGIFSRSPDRRSPPLLTAAPADLVRIADTAFGGPSVYPPGLSTAELDRYAIAFLTAAGFPKGGSAAEGASNRQFLDELLAAAESAGSWAFVGAMCVAWNCVTPAYRSDARYLSILDRALEALRLDGVSYTAVPQFAIDRWTSIHGYGESGPAGWPSALTYLPVPDVAHAPPVTDLADGESRRLAQAPAAPANSIYCELRPAGVVQAVVEGVDPETGTLRRWDWEGLSAPDYPSFLRELGDRLVTHSQWAHDDLIPYFPCRQRSRDQMRMAAAEYVPR